MMVKEQARPSSGVEKTWRISRLYGFNGYFPGSVFSAVRGLGLRILEVTGSRSRNPWLQSGILGKLCCFDAGNLYFVLHHFFSCTFFAPLFE